MQKVRISDITLREDSVMSFKEKVNLAKKLDKLLVDVIETSKIRNIKTDVLFLHTIAPLIKNSVISCPCELSKESVKTTAEALSAAKKFRLKLEVPTSIVQMEYLCGKKPDKVLELIEELVTEAKKYSEDVEFSAMDATRSEAEFLYKAIKKAIDCGATTITVCDSTGEMLPNEFEEFIDNLYKNVSKLKDVTLSAECNGSLNLATACIALATIKGVGEVKASLDGKNVPKLIDIAKVFKAKGDSLKVTANLNYAELEHTVARLGFYNIDKEIKSDKNENISNEGIVLSDKDNIDTVSMAVEKLGYDLSKEDRLNVYEEFVKVAKKKPVGEKELDVIVASVALQTAPTYKLKNYIINSGNVINASCVMVLTRDGQELQGMTVGDGPIDAAFQCIEKIAGRHFELDDFQIQSVTEGKEAVGVTIIKLRSQGKLYSGKGVSTDIVESSINAYINALNKICFEEV